MKISNKLSDKDRHYLNNLQNSGAGEIPDESGKVSEKATHVLKVDKGFIVGAEKILRQGDKDYAIEKRKK